MIKGNKGEWSEVYTLLKVISDRQLFAGDSDLNKVETLIYPIIKVLRDETNGTFEFTYDNDLVVIKNDLEEIRISVLEFQKQAHLLLKKLKEKTDATFSIPEIEDFINSFNSHSLKAKSTVKSDIRIVIHDFRTGATPHLGFSIKSQIGKPATLFNSSLGSNFIFEICDVKLSHEEIDKINSINSGSKIQDRVKEIILKGGNLVFQKCEGTIFENNLTLIDSLLPQIVSKILIEFNSKGISKLSKLVSNIESQNPLNFNKANNHNFYHYKIKRFLTDIALGMVPTTVWTGELDSTGGYLVVKESGEVLCYHIYNRNEFEDYLLSNTKIINPSSTRQKFGKIYVENDKMYFKLNLQIRFIK